METKEGEQDYLLGKPLSKANSSAGSVTNALIRRDSRTWTAPSAALKRISRPFDTAGQANSMIMFGVGLCVFQAVLLFFFGFFTTPYGEMIPDDSAKYAAIVDWIANGNGVLRSERVVDGKEPGTWHIFMVWLDVRGYIPKAAVGPEGVPLRRRN